jgi:hypothetical protein
MDDDMSEVGQSHQDQDAGNTSCFENHEEAPQINGMVLNQTKNTAPERSNTTVSEQP